MGVDNTENCKLYIRYPTRIENEFVIRSLHPNIVGVHLPRQKSRRWCVVDFENQEQLEETKAALKQVKIHSKLIKFRVVRRSEDIPHKNTGKESSTEVSTNLLLKLLKKE